MRISKKTNNLNFTCDKIYNYISDINNYELILGDEIKDFNIIDKEIFCIKIGGLTAILGFRVQSILQITLSKIIKR